MNTRSDRIATAMFWAAAGVVMLLLVYLLGYIGFKGWQAISWGFLTLPPENLRAGGGVGPQIFNSFYLLLLATGLTAPIGLGAAIYLAEYARPGKILSAIRLSIETLASLPSIVVGLFGLLVFVTFTGWGYSLIAGALALTVLNLPVMVRVCEEAIRAVPVELREASLALGADQWQTIRKVVLPSALPGIATGVIFTAGRVFGEAAALLYTSGMSSPALDFGDWNPMSYKSPLNIFRPAETLAVHIWKVNSEGLIPDVGRIANGASLVLIAVVLCFNVLARWAGARVHKSMTGR